MLTVLSLVAIVCLLRSTIGFGIVPVHLKAGRKFLLSKLTMKGGQVTGTDSSKPTLVYFDARYSIQQLKCIDPNLCVNFCLNYCIYFYLSMH